MASAIGVLFVRQTAEPLAVPAPRDHQYMMFDCIAKILDESLTEAAAETLKDDEKEDEGVNRSSSMLACLKQICLISPICEKRAIALLFQAVNEQFLDKDLVKKVKKLNGWLWENLHHVTYIYILHYNLFYN